VPAKPTILLVEPSREGRELRRRILERHGYQVVAVSSPNGAVPAVARSRVGIVLLDVPADGAMWTGLDTVRTRYPLAAVIVMQEPPSLGHAVEAMRRGAADYVPRSLDPDALLEIVRSTLHMAEAARPLALAELIERSAAMQHLMQQVRRVGPSDANVVLYGESGVGKEVVARYIHGISPRCTRELVPINCASLSEDILENELFGHERGAFTSANEAKAGVFELAAGGTLFLDEVGEMGLRCQAKLLRVIERKEFRRVGGTKKVKVDLRIIAATNRDLPAAVASRSFREDLYYRLSVVSLRIPPLRERREVIPEMAKSFLAEFAPRTPRRLRGISPEVMAKLVNYDWPGNVRELRNVLESLALTSLGSRIELEDLPSTIRDAEARRDVAITVGAPMAEIEREIFRAYIRVYGSKKGAAQALEIPLRTFHAKAKRCGL
jgi:DNA-binding NtrC family response regulator